MFKDFLSAAKGPERMVERKRRDAEASDAEMGDATAEMWLSFQQMAAFCPASVVDAAKAYMDAIHEELAVDPGVELGALMTPARSRLTREARAAFADFK